MLLIISYLFTLQTSICYRFVELKIFMRVIDNKFCFLLLFFVFLLIAPFQITAQNEMQFSFGAAHDDYGKRAIETDDHGFLILGSTWSFGTGFRDVIITRTDSTGNIIWSKTYGTPVSDAIVTMKKDQSGGYVILFGTNGIASLMNEAYVLRIDNDGNPIHEQFFGGPLDDDLYDFDLTDDGGYIFSGGSESFGSNADAIWIIKTDASFSPEWTKIFDCPGPLDHIRKIKETSDGHFIGLGYMLVYGDGHNHILVYLNDAGDVVWIKDLEGEGEGNDRSRDLLIADNGNFVCIGVFGPSFFNDKIVVYEVDPNGNPVWAKTYQSSLFNDAISIARGLDGNYMIACCHTNLGGDAEEDIVLININNNGDLIKANIIGGTYHSYFPYVSATSDSGYVVTCGTPGDDETYSDILVIKTDSEGASCCSSICTDLVIEDVDLTLRDITYTVGSGVEHTSRNISVNSHTISSSLLCYKGISILGDDTVCSSTGPFKYSLTPNLDHAFQWSLPPGATISSTIGDTVIFVEFGTQSG